MLKYKLKFLFKAIHQMIKSKNLYSILFDIFLNENFNLF